MNGDVSVIDAETLETPYGGHLAAVDGYAAGHLDGGATADGELTHAVALALSVDA